MMRWGWFGGDGPFWVDCIQKLENAKFLGVDTALSENPKGLRLNHLRVQEIVKV
jgi:hypothetical protein